MSAVLEVLLFLEKIIAELGYNYTEENLKIYLRNRLKSGLLVPGFGHAVLRKTDPRYECQRQFALEHLPNDKMFRLVSTLYKV